MRILRNRNQGALPHSRRGGELCPVRRSVSRFPVQPHYAAPLASRDHVAAGFLALLLGVFGVHKFYLGCNAGFTLLALTVIGGLFHLRNSHGVVWIVSAIEAIAYFSKARVSSSKYTCMANVNGFSPLGFAERPSVSCTARNE